MLTTSYEEYIEVTKKKYQIYINPDFKLFIQDIETSIKLFENQIRNLAEKPSMDNSIVIISLQKAINELQGIIDTWNNIPNQLMAIKKTSNT